tara:strand:- start:331 stop:690 length:360 start_codon:yes stop_codon:yes gene_type:complete
MKIFTEKLETLTIVTVDCKSLDDLEHITKAIANSEEGHKNIILDLAQTTSINASELIQFEEIQNSLDLLEKSFVICGVNNDLQSAFNEKFGEDFFNIVPTRNEAVDMVYMEEQERSFFN